MLPGDFDIQILKPTRKRVVLGLVALASTLGFLVVLGFVLTFILSSWWARPIVFGYDEGPDQPIAFPHTTHVQDLGMECTFCHRNVEKGASASVPAVSLCMTCHKVVGDDSEEVAKLREYYDLGKSINWVRIHRVPDHVQFVHDAHIKHFSGEGKTVVETMTNPDSQIFLEDAKKMKRDSSINPGDIKDIESSEVCAVCHGDVASMSKVKQVRPLKMGDCVNCHRDNNAPAECAVCHY